MEHGTARFAIGTEELVREQGANMVLLDGICDRMGMKVLGLANHSKSSIDYLKQFCSAKLDWAR